MRREAEEVQAQMIPARRILKIIQKVSDGVILLTV